MSVIGFLIVCFFIGLPFYVVFKWLFKPRKKTPKPRVLREYTQEQREQLYLIWCGLNNLSINRRRSEASLRNYVLSNDLPTLEEFKEANGYNRLEWVPRKVYTDWIKYIGAYNSKFDPDSPDWDKK